MNLEETSRLVWTCQANAGVTVLGPEHHLNIAASRICVVADHVHTFMTTVRHLSTPDHKDRLKMVTPAVLRSAVAVKQHHVHMDQNLRVLF